MTIELSWDAFSSPVRTTIGRKWINGEDVIAVHEGVSGDQVCLAKYVEFGEVRDPWWKGLEIIGGTGARLAMLDLEGAESGPECASWGRLRDGKLVFWKAKGFGVRTPMYHLMLGDLEYRRSSLRDSVVRNYVFEWIYDSYLGPPDHRDDWFPGEIRQGYGGEPRCELAARHSGKVLDVWSWSHANGAAIVQWDSHGGANQRWKFERLSDGRYRVHSENTQNQVLDIAGMSQASGARLTQWASWGGANQMFDLVAVDPGYYKIVAKHSGKCLSVAGGSRDNGAHIVQWDWHGGHEQQWRIRRLV